MRQRYWTIGGERLCDDCYPRDSGGWSNQSPLGDKIFISYNSPPTRPKWSQFIRGECLSPEAYPVDAVLTKKINYVLLDLTATIFVCRPHGLDINVILSTRMSERRLKNDFVLTHKMIHCHIDLPELRRPLPGPLIQPGEHEKAFQSAPDQLLLKKQLNSRICL